MGNILHRAGREVIHADNLVAFGDKPVTEMASKKSGAAGDKGAWQFGLNSDLGDYDDSCDFLMSNHFVDFNKMVCIIRLWHRRVKSFCQVRLCGAACPA